MTATGGLWNVPRGPYANGVVASLWPYWEAVGPLQGPWTDTSRTNHSLLCIKVALLWYFSQQKADGPGTWYMLVPFLRQRTQGPAGNSMEMSMGEALVLLLSAPPMVRGLDTTSTCMLRPCCNCQCHPRLEWPFCAVAASPLCFFLLLWEHRQGVRGRHKAQSWLLPLGIARLLLCSSSLPCHSGFPHK